MKVQDGSRILEWIGQSLDSGNEGWSFVGGSAVVAFGMRLRFDGGVEERVLPWCRLHFLGEGDIGGREVDPLPNRYHSNAGSPLPAVTRQRSQRCEYRKDALSWTNNAPHAQMRRTLGFRTAGTAENIRSTMGASCLDSGWCGTGGGQEGLSVLLAAVKPVSTAEEVCGCNIPRSKSVGPLDLSISTVELHPHQQPPRMFVGVP